MSDAQTMWQCPDCGERMLARDQWGCLQLAGRDSLHIAAGLAKAATAAKPREIEAAREPRVMVIAPTYQPGLDAGYKRDDIITRRTRPKARGRQADYVIAVNLSPRDAADMIDDPNIAPCFAHLDGQPDIKFIQTGDIR